MQWNTDITNTIFEVNRITLLATLQNSPIDNGSIVVNEHPLSPHIFVEYMAFAFFDNPSIVCIFLY
ncbi:hypothetical protein BDZ91DRAFT_711280 [Kalaharituber pfeilii]|nr:hypothetical protein BDZ91DRAFT_711280 [Kalaharituber pfeilii]